MTTTSEKDQKPSLCSSRTAKSVFAFSSFGTRLVFDDVIQVKYTDEITLVMGNEACDLDSGR